MKCDGTKFVLGKQQLRRRISHYHARMDPVIELLLYFGVTRTPLVTDAKSPSSVDNSYFRSKASLVSGEGTEIETSCNTMSLQIHL